MESNKPEEKVLYYGDYLQLNNILNAQKPIVRPGATGPPEHEQMLFIIVHQTYELWFKQVLHELDSITDILSHPILDDNSPQMQTVVDRLKRINTILRVLVHQIDIVETLTPMQFLQFRNLLVPSSGFQSWQFKLIDARLGLVEEQRHGLNYYVSVLREEDIQKIREAEAKPTLLKLFGEWLERMPFFNAEFWGGQIGEEIPPEQHPFWTEWERNYDESLRENEKSNLERFRKVMFSEKRGEHCQLSAKACRSALFISAYQLYPILSQPFAFLQELL
jgi:tryptophan 2,3-dioxygenase